MSVRGRKHKNELCKYPELAAYMDRWKQTYAEFGMDIGLSGKQVYNIMSGKARPSVKVIDKICELTRLTYIHDEFGGNFVDFPKYLKECLADMESALKVIEEKDREFAHKVTEAALSRRERGTDISDEDTERFVLASFAFNKIRGD